MTTIKTVGCGGRYSYIAFLPCQVCLAETELECTAITRRNRTEKHEEYWRKR
ncbi:MAG TPA: hypothetical protein VI727_04085 [Candidatus Brocadiaceae bacterium]|nr:hypothetical protein [Candidatus Brocadiaceae bacterium]